MSPALDSVIPPADPVLDPLLSRAKPLRRSGAHTIVMARKPALAAMDPERLSMERRMAEVLRWVMENYQHEDGRIGVSNVELASWIGISESIVRRWKTREKTPNAYHLAKLPQHFRMALDHAWSLLFVNPVANDR